MPTTIYVASAGTGKTTALMAELEEALNHSTPEQIIFTTFTNAGAQEIARRAAARFPQFKEHQFRYFRTLHSIAYRNIPHQQMMNFADYVQLARETGLPLNAKRAFQGAEGHVSPEFNIGDHLLHLDALKRNKRISWSEVATLQEMSTLSPEEIRKFSETYRKFRRKIRKYDFTDQLEQFLASIDEFNVPLTHLFVDEAQDLSPLQWEIIEKLEEKVLETVIAGDDKQAIYGFNGGDPRKLIRKEGSRKVLGKSYRLPERVLGYAEGIASRLTEKQPYTCAGNGQEGSVSHVYGLMYLKEQMSRGSWFILARNRKFLPMLESDLNRMGVLYESDTGNSPVTKEMIECIGAWNELLKGYPIEARHIKKIYQRYLRGADTVAYGFKKTIQHLDDDESVDLGQLKEGFGLLTELPWDQCFHLADLTRELLLKLQESGDLGEPPRIRLTTMHAVKGQEADNVVLLPDLSHLTKQGYLKNADDEHRVFYVAATRAKQNLFILYPYTNHSYPMP